MLPLGNGSLEGAIPAPDTQHRLDDRRDGDFFNRPAGEARIVPENSGNGLVDPREEIPLPKETVQIFDCKGI
jgi:hypothetical protein